MASDKVPVMLPRDVVDSYSRADYAPESSAQAVCDACREALAAMEPAPKAEPPEVLWGNRVIKIDWRDHPTLTGMGSGSEGNRVIKIDWRDHPMGGKRGYFAVSGFFYAISDASSFDHFAGILYAAPEGGEWNLHDAHSSGLPQQWLYVPGLGAIYAYHCDGRWWRCEPWTKGAKPAPATHVLWRP